MTADPTIVARLDEATFGSRAAASHAASVAAAIESPAIGRWRGGSCPGVWPPGLSHPADQPFRIASITKPFVAATLHRLARAGSLDLRSPVRTLVAPDTAALLQRGGYDPDAITVEHLLSHTSGLVDHSTTPEYESEVLARPQRRWTRLEQVAYASEPRSERSVSGECYSYSDTGYVLLGEIIERSTGRSLAEAVRRELQFEALGLAHTWWEQLEVAPAGTPPLARQFHDDVDVTGFNASFDVYGGGGIVSTVGDLARFARALFDGTVLDRRELLYGLRTPAARRDQVSQPWRTHGYLVATFRIGQRWVLGHTGAWGSAMVYCPEHDIALAATVNRSGLAAREDLFELVDRLIDVATSA
jgi:D-alanyl-D-alanine carboxypeptidase